VPDNSTGSRKRRRGASKRRVGFGFNAKSREAQRWAKEFVGERITTINTETKLAVRKIVVDSIREGIPPRDAAKQIREMVGLNRPQGLALRRYVQNLSPSLSPAAKAKAGIKLKNKMIRRRAITIARTEVIDSLSGGVEQAWVQAQQKGLLGSNAKKEWVTTPFGACAICRALNGQSVKITGMFSSEIGPLARPTAHPNCRCGIAPVPGVGGMMQPAGLPPTVTPSMAAALTSEGLLIHGSDARKALLKFADKEGRQVEEKLAILQKKFSEESDKAFTRIHEIEARFIELRNKHTQWINNRLVWNKGTESYRREWKVLTEESETLKKKLKRLNAKKIDTQEAVLDVALEKFVYNKTDITSVNLTVGRTMDAAQKKQWRVGSAAWRKMVDDEIYATQLAGTVDEIKAVPLKNKRSIKAVKDKDNGNGRAWADYNKDNPDEYIVFQGNGRHGRDATAAVVHELSHTLEFSSPELMAEAIRFRNILTKGDELKSLRDITGNLSYSADEFAYVSDNLETYATKVYNYTSSLGERTVQKNIRHTRSFDDHIASRVWSDRDGWNTGTEIVTMGVQRMYDNPVSFARDYPQFFDFIYERVIKRKYTNNTSKWALKLNDDIRFAENPVVKSTGTFGYEGDPEMVAKAVRKHRLQEEAIRNIRLVEN